MPVSGNNGIPHPVDTTGKLAEFFVNDSEIIVLNESKLQEFCFATAFLGKRRETGRNEFYYGNRSSQSNRSV
jgi:hypothetical protein